MTTRTTAHPEVLPQRESWHTLTPEEVQQRLHSGPSSQKIAEAHRRLARYGPNRLAAAAHRGPLLRLLMQFHNILLYVMLAAAAITAVLGHWVDTGVLLAAVVINAIIGFIQEGKAETLGSVTVICSDKIGP